MRIAIVGAGVAGMAAAWRLGEAHDVLVYEADDRPGGHAWTVDVPVEDAGGGRVPIDVGFQLYHDGVNPNLQALFTALDVPTEPVAFSLASFGRGDAWTNNGQRTPFGDAISGEVARFLRDVPRLAGLSLETSLEHFFASGRYSADFRHKLLAPLLSFWWVSRAALFAMPAAAVAAGVLQGALSFTGPTTWRAVRGGSREYVRRLSARFADRILLGTPVSRIQRAPDRVVIHDKRGGVREFDHVILAADAVAALSLLDAPTPEEQALLASIRFEDSTLAVHRDERLMPPERALWSYGNYRDAAATGAPGQLGGEMTYWQPRPGNPSVFVTVVTPRTRIPKEKVFARRRWRHMVFDTALLSRQLAPLQGRKRTWFCGGHTAGLPVHEHALCSGLAVAEALGAAYPFAGNEAALAAYASFKRRVI